jgi:hypothetical protein
MEEIGADHGSPLGRLLSTIYSGRDEKKEED